MYVKRMYSFHVSISATWNVSDKTLILVGRSLYTIKLIRAHSQRANSINFSSIRLIQSGPISTSLETLDAFWYYKQLHQTSFRTYSHKRYLKVLNFYHQKHCFFLFIYTYLILYGYEDTRIIFGKNFFLNFHYKFNTNKYSYTISSQYRPPDIFISIYKYKIKCPSIAILLRINGNITVAGNVMK